MTFKVMSFKTLTCCLLNTLFWMTLSQLDSKLVQKNRQISKEARRLHEHSLPFIIKVKFVAALTSFITFEHTVLKEKEKNKRTKRNINIPFKVSVRLQLAFNKFFFN